MYKFKTKKLDILIGFLLQIFCNTNSIAQEKDVNLAQLNEAINLEMYGATRLLQAGGGEILFLVNSNDDIIIYQINSGEVIAEFNFEGHINYGKSMENGNVIFCGSNDLGDGIVKIYTPLGIIKDSLVINNDIPMSMLINTEMCYFGTENGVIYTCDNNLNVSNISKLHISSIYDLGFISNEEIAILTTNEIYTFRVQSKSDLQSIYFCDTCSFFKLLHHAERLYFASYSNLFAYDLNDKSTNVISMKNTNIVDLFINTLYDKLNFTTKEGALWEINTTDFTPFKIKDILQSPDLNVNDITETHNNVNERKQILSYVLVENLADNRYIDTLFVSNIDTFYLELINNIEVLIAQTNGKFTIFNLSNLSSVQYQSKAYGVNSMYLAPDKEKFLVSLYNTGWNYLQLPEFKGIASSRSSHNINSIICTYDGRHTIGYYGSSTDDFYQFDVEKLYYNPKKDFTLKVKYINDSVITNKYSTSKGYPLLTLQANSLFKVYDNLYNLAFLIDSVISYANVETTNTVFLFKESKKLISKTLGKENENFILDLSGLLIDQNLNSIETKMEISDNGSFLAILLFDRFYILDLSNNNLRNSVFIDKNYTVSDFEVNDNGRLIYSVIDSSVINNLNLKEVNIPSLPSNYLFYSYYDINLGTLYLISSSGLIYTYRID